MNDLANRLKKHPFLKDVDYKTIEYIASFTAEVDFEPGEFIFRSGDVADKFYLVQFGKIIIEISPEYHSDINIQTVEDGELIGWSWLIHPYEWQFEAKVTEKTRAFAIDAKLLRVLCKHNQEAGFVILTRLIEVIAKRLYATRNQFWDIYKMHYLMSGPF